MDILITDKGGSLMHALAYAWGGKAGLQDDCQLAREALAKARMRLVAIWQYRDDLYAARRTGILASLMRCRRAVRRTEAELAEWFRDHQKFLTTAQEKNNNTAKNSYTTSVNGDYLVNEIA